MTLTSSVGMVAGALTTFCYLFQVTKSWKTKHTKDLAMGTFLALTLGTILWLLYGIMLNEPPIYIANGVTLALSLSLVYLKIQYG